LPQATSKRAVKQIVESFEKRNSHSVTAANNKRLVEQIYSELSRGNSQPFIESLADDVCWTVTGTTKWSKTYRGKQTVLTELLTPLRAQFANQYTAVADRFVAEGDLVVVEVRGRVITKTGHLYNNRYCYVIRLEDNTLIELTEYMDTELVAAVLGDPGVQSA
jgi:uncharacterized protein